MAVKNPCGLKKPVIQNEYGRPLLHQRLNWASLSNNSVYQNPSVADSQDICQFYQKEPFFKQKNKYGGKMKSHIFIIFSFTNALSVIFFFCQRTKYKGLLSTRGMIVLLTKISKEKSYFLYVKDT